ncbi:hypothetical protein GJ744_003432 [Endocarpon pusillum]|uniref:Protein kinase domain-containing protein n=1 Tax=Endocarpon pusillum TaxID=364733 RepID=A0A8H7A937_9EURO|nr:hypothetical protein GJ744_003432 [Endocarpon pusillum]
MPEPYSTFAATLGVVHEIYTITVFIKSTVETARMYEADKALIRERLQVELYFLESFESLFFNGDGAFILGQELATKNPADEVNGPSNNLSSPSGQTQKELFLTRNSPQSGQLGSKQKYRQWSGSLQAIMSHMLQVAQRFQEPQQLVLFSESKVARDTGLCNVARRQLLAQGDPPGSFGPLPGEFRIVEGHVDRYILGAYRDGPEWTTVLVEWVTSWAAKGEDLSDRRIDLYCDYDDEQVAMLRRLAWLLHNAESPVRAGTDDGADTMEQPPLYILNCLGYFDANKRLLDPRMCLTYTLPPNIGDTEYLATLYDCLAFTHGTAGKTTVGERFSLAYALALTVLNLHGSGWLHKSIFSKGVVLSGYKWIGPMSVRDKGQPLILYLTGWGDARLQRGGTKLAPSPLADRIYRHPERQHKPRFAFTKEHDIYALGVVLLEIGSGRRHGL